MAKLVAGQLHLTPFWRAGSAGLMPPVDATRLPASLLGRFSGDAEEQLATFLSFLGPITGGASMRFLMDTTVPQRMPVAARRRPL